MTNRDTPLRLGYLVPQFPGQTHIFFWREIRELEARGVAVSILSTRPPPPGLIAHKWSQAAMARTRYLGQASPLGLLGGAARAPWGELMTEARRSGKGVLKDVAVCLPAARALIATARAQGLTHVHAHSCGRAALIAALARCMGGPAYSVTLHGPLSDYGPGQGFKWRHAEFATIITRKLHEEVQAELGADMPARVAIQPMGVDVDVLCRAAPYVPRGAEEPLRVFSCGRLNMVKGHQDLASTVKRLRDESFPVEVEIAGEDDAGGQGYRHELQAHIDGLGLADHVRLLGAIDADEVRARLEAAHVFVLASWHEPLGVAYMEAMACEVPTIGTDAGGVRELIRDGQDGLLVPPRDPAALAAALRRLAGDPGLAAGLSRAGRARIVEGFSAARGAETLISEIAGEPAQIS